MSLGNGEAEAAGFGLELAPPPKGSVELLAKLLPKVTETLVDLPLDLVA